MSSVGVRSVLPLGSTPSRTRRPLIVGIGVLALVAACGSGSITADDGGGADDDAATTPDGSTGDGSLADAAPLVDASPAVGTLSGLLRVDHFGWRPGDAKVAVLAGLPGAEVEVRGGDNSVVATLTSSGLNSDEDSGDQVALLDLSSVTLPDSYYLYYPDEDLRSVRFTVADDVYDIVGEAAVKALYYQRCNQERALPYAGDALGGFPGIGGQWVDDACHLGDSAATAGPGSPDHGALDLTGGWHDAGDYQKTLWGRGVGDMLWAYELNPSAWRDDQLDIPESGNGVPDLLDEIRWELDFYVRMQRPDGHFMTSVKGRNGTSMSPPSSADEVRVYFDTTAPSGDGWSGGGVTLVQATANAVRALAHAAIVFDSVGETSSATAYREAAMAGWSWLDANAGGSDEALVCAAASAVYRLDPTETSAKSRVEGFSWSTWGGALPYSVTPGDRVLTQAAWHYLSNAAADSGKKSEIRTAVSQAIVERAFAQEGAYGGMYGDSANGWDWGWGSNANQSLYGANLLIAARLGAIGDRSETEVVRLAQKYLHYLLGLNPLNMVYPTNMAAYGGEHSSFQIYHGWFSFTGNDGDHGNATYNGKPVSVDEPSYPYYPDDDQTSTYGPAPGILPGGPNWYYGGAYEIPNRQYPAYAYRDWSVGCDWDGSVCASASWEITEPMCAYQGPFILLLSFAMSDS